MSITEVTQGYLDANVAAQSILTDLSFFGGTMADLMEARVINQEKPILRKDFIVDGFQIVEAKAIGADVILLIAACLTPLELKNYGILAKELGLEVLYEVHTQEDLDKIGDLDNKIIGIITDGDIRRMLNKTETIAGLTAKEIMTVNPKTIKSTDLVSDALNILEDFSITQLVVVDGNEYKGVLHLHDILKEGIV